MAATGFDALMIDEARLGRAANRWTGARSLAASPVQGTVEGDGTHIYRGSLASMPAGNRSHLLRRLARRF